MAKAFISINGLYCYDDTIFNDMILPVGLNRQNLIAVILAENCDIELLYPDAGLMKILLRRWAEMRFHSWERLYQSTIKDYNPLYNYDRTEVFDRDANNKGSAQEIETENNIKTAGFDSGNLVDSSKNTQTIKPARDENKLAFTTTKDHYKLTAQGNIGVTTPHQMLEGERELYKYDVYLAISQEFKQRFTLGIY